MSEETTEVVEAVVEPVVEAPKVTKVTKAKAVEPVLPEGAVLLNSGILYIPS
jgi:hypothetical protein